MKSLIFLSLLSVLSFGSEAAAKIDEGKKITDDTNAEIEKVNVKNDELVKLDKEKNVKILNLDFIQQKINGQNGS